MGYRTALIGIIVLVFASPLPTSAKGFQDLLQAREDRAKTENTVSGDTPLHIAARTGKHNVIDTLISQGARVNRPNSGGSTPLHAAAEHGRTSVVERLLAREADVNRRDFRGRTPLYRTRSRS